MVLNQQSTPKSMLSKAKYLTICGPDKSEIILPVTTHHTGEKVRCLPLRCDWKGKTKGKFNSIWHQKPRIQIQTCRFFDSVTVSNFLVLSRPRFLHLQKGYFSHIVGERKWNSTYESLFCILTGQGNMSCLWGGNWGSDILSSSQSYSWLIQSLHWESKFFQACFYKSSLKKPAKI